MHGHLALGRFVQHGGERARTFRAGDLDAILAAVGEAQRRSGRLGRIAGQQSGALQKFARCLHASTSSSFSSKPLSATVGEQHFRGVAVQREHLPDQVADLFAAALVEHQDGRAGAAQRASQQAGRAQFEHVGQARHQFHAVRLMEAIFERRGKGRGGAGGQRRHQQGGALHVEDGVLARVAGGQHLARFAWWAGRNRAPRWRCRSAAAGRPARRAPRRPRRWRWRRSSRARRPRHYPDGLPGAPLRPESAAASSPGRADGRRSPRRRSAPRRSSPGPCRAGSGFRCAARWATSAGARSRATASAVCQIRLSGPVEMESASRPLA